MTATVIDAKFAGYYWKLQGEDTLKEAPQAIEKRYVFWNHMTHLSMQNAVSQMVTKKNKVA